MTAKVKRLAFACALAVLAIGGVRPIYRQGVAAQSQKHKRQSRGFVHCHRVACAPIARRQYGRDRRDQRWRQQKAGGISAPGL